MGNSASRRQRERIGALTQAVNELQQELTQGAFHNQIFYRLEHLSNRISQVENALGDLGKTLEKRQKRLLRENRKSLTSIPEPVAENVHVSANDSDPNATLSPPTPTTDVVLRKKATPAANGDSHSAQREGIRRSQRRLSFRAATIQKEDQPASPASTSPVTGRKLQPEESPAKAPPTAPVQRGASVQEFIIDFADGHDEGSSRKASREEDMLETSAAFMENDVMETSYTSDIGEASPRSLSPVTALSNPQSSVKTDSDDGKQPQKHRNIAVRAADSSVTAPSRREGTHPSSPARAEATANGSTSKRSPTTNTEIVNSQQEQQATRVVDSGDALTGPQQRSHVIAEPKHPDSEAAHNDDGEPVATAVTAQSEEDGAQSAQHSDIATSDTVVTAPTQSSTVDTKASEATTRLTQPLIRQDSEDVDEKPPPPPGEPRRRASSISVMQQRKQLNDEEGAGDNGEEVDGGQDREAGSMLSVSQTSSTGNAPNESEPGTRKRSVRKHTKPVLDFTGLDEDDDPIGRLFPQFN